MVHRQWLSLGLLWYAVAVVHTGAQIDPDHRRLIQLGYNQPLEGRGPIAGYGFYYHNQPGFIATNMTLRLTVAPIYLDTELGFTGVLSPNTDVAVGISGGGFADSYSEIRQGMYRRNESFLGHGGEVSASVYHRFNPDALLPFWIVFRGSIHHSVFDADDNTDSAFIVPGDLTYYRFRTGVRLGGREPTMTAPLAVELSVWHEGELRGDDQRYGYGDRRISESSHLFWGRALGKYTFDESQQLIELSLTVGTSVDVDRFSAYRLGGVLPFASEFPLNIPGYYFEELAARRFVLLNGQYSFPLERTKCWNFTTFAATGWVDYLSGLEQPGDWHSGAGAGITFVSPRASWFVTLMYSHGFDAIRTDGRGANQVGVLFQYDFQARKNGRPRRFTPDVDPYRSRGGERLFRTP